MLDCIVWADKYTLLYAFVLSFLVMFSALAIAACRLGDQAVQGILDSAEARKSDPPSADK